MILITIQIIKMSHIHTIYNFSIHYKTIRIKFIVIQFYLLQMLYYYKKLIFLINN